MKIALIGVDEASRGILLDGIRMAKRDVEIEEHAYHSGVFAGLRGQAPRLIVFDISGRPNCLAICADIFTQLPRSCLLLIGGVDISAYEHNKIAPVLYMPYVGYMQKPLGHEDVKAAFEKMDCEMPKRKVAVNEAGIVPENNLVQIFQYDILLAHLFKGEASAAEMEKICALLGVVEGEERYFRVFAVQSKNEENDPLPNNFALFATLQQYIRCKNMTTCNSPIHLTGVLSSSSRLLLPQGGVEWMTLEGWLRDKGRVPQALFVSFSPVFDCLEDAPLAYQCAITGLKQSFFTGYRAISENGVSFAEKLLYDKAKHFADKYSLLLLAENRQGMVDMAQELYERVRALDVNHIFGIQSIYTQLFYRLSMSENLLKKQAVQEDLLSENVHALVKGIDTLEELHQKLLDRIDEVFDGALSATSSAEHNAMRILEFIRKNYHDPSLSLQSISENIFLSPSHISAEFKKVIGLPVAKYLNSYRIEQSKYLLENPANRLESVAQTVGYNNARQFAKVFKRVEGISPSEYRQARRGGTAKQSPA